MEGGERPGDGVRIHSHLHLVIFRDIDAIIVGEEIVIAHAAVDEDGNYSKDDADSGDLPGLPESLRSWSLPQCRHRWWPFSLRLAWDLFCRVFPGMIAISPKSLEREQDLRRRCTLASSSCLHNHYFFILACAKARFCLAPASAGFKLIASRNWSAARSNSPC